MSSGLRPGDRGVAPAVLPSCGSPSAATRPGDDCSICSGWLDGRAVLEQRLQVRLAWGAELQHHVSKIGPRLQAMLNGLARSWEGAPCPSGPGEASSSPNHVNGYSACLASGNPSFDVEIQRCPHFVPERRASPAAISGQAIACRQPTGPDPTPSYPPAGMREARRGCGMISDIFVHINSGNPGRGIPLTFRGDVGGLEDLLKGNAPAQRDCLIVAPRLIQY